MLNAYKSSNKKLIILHLIQIQCIDVIAEKSTSIQHMLNVFHLKTKTKLSYSSYSQYILSIDSIFIHYVNEFIKNCWNRRATKSKNCVYLIYIRRTLRFFVSYALFFMIDVEKMFNMYWMYIEIEFIIDCIKFFTIFVFDCM